MMISACTPTDDRLDGNRLKFIMSQTRRSKRAIACGFVAVCWLLAWVFGRLVGLQIIGLLFAIAGAFAFVGLVKTMIVDLN